MSIVWNAALPGIQEVRKIGSGISGASLDLGKFLSKTTDTEVAVKAPSTPSSKSPDGTQLG
jgi:hypothetical protein